MRSLTRSVRPCSGPGMAAAGSTSVMTAFQLSTDECHSLDLDECAGDREAAHLDERARWARVAEHLLPHGVHRPAVVDVREEDGHLDDVAEPGARGGAHRTEVRENLTRLRDDVAADQPAVAVDGDAA